MRQGTSQRMSQVISQRGAATYQLVVVVLLVSIVGLLAWPMMKPAGAPRFETQYQAVLLAGGQVYFGHLEGFGTPFPVLRDVFYVQSTVDPTTKNVSNILVQRGKEWHGPDRMYLNPGSIVLVEPVGADSQVAKLIAEKKGK
jgi:hypothetical protein